MKHKIFSLLLIMLLSTFSMWAEDGNWVFNPYDFQYDMTAYVSLKVNGNSVDDLANYKVGAFCGDQCRGIMDFESAAGHQYGYLRIRSNKESGELITFQVFDLTTGAPLKCENTLEFVSQAVQGVPSSPLILNAVYKYKVHYVVFDEIYKTEEVYYGDQIPSIEAPEIEGYTFSQWLDLPETMPAHDVTITGSYTINSYILTFKIDDEVISDAVVEYGSKIDAPTAPEKEGYTFTGWDAYPETMPANDLTINGSYTINSYKLAYVIDGEVIEETEVEYGSAITAIDAPEKEGYTFNGWSEIPETMPAHDVTVTGSYTVNTYTLIFKIDDEVISEAVVEYGSKIDAPTAPEKEGYTFTGWDEYSETMPANDLTINGSYTINSYKLAYVLDGEVVEETVVEYGTSISALEEPEKEGYTFSGWDGLPETMPANDVTVTGSFTVNSYTLIFKIGNVIVSETVVEYGSEIVEPEAPEKEGFDFAGWDEHPDTMPAYDLTINGHYEGNSYKLTYMIDGEVIAEVDVEFDANIDDFNAPEKEGYNFNGWEGLPETMPAHDVTVTGSYTINSYVLTFHIDNEVISQTEVEYGSKVVAPEAPEKEGYTFNGWSEVPETMPAHDVTVTGSYTVNTYTLTFIIDDEIISEQTVEYGSKIDAPEAPEKEGYTFNGWSDVPETMPAHDVTVNGSYIVNTYTLTFIIDGEIIFEQTVEYGSKITSPEAPEKEGYTFEGWEEYPETMPAEDLTVYGSYNVNTYIVTYIIDDEVIRVDYVEYGELLPEAPEAPEKEDYDFVGWSDIPETMPAHDITIVGTYEYNAGLNSILEDSVQVDIFDIQGRLIKKNVDSDRISDYVPTGLYIIGGKKVLVK